MKKTTARIILILIILILATVACVGGGEGYESNSAGTPQADIFGISIQATQSADVTATYGAEQFHLQLTAIAEQEQQ